MLIMLMIVLRMGLLNKKYYGSKPCELYLRITITLSAMLLVSQVLDSMLKRNLIVLMINID